MSRRSIRRPIAALLAAAGLLAVAPAATAAPANSATATCPTMGVPWGTTVGLTAGQELAPGHRLDVPGVTAVMQWDGNLVIYLMTPDGHQGPPLWSSNTYGNWGAHAVMQADGNFVIYRQNSTDRRDALWSTGTFGHPGTGVYLYRDGDFGVATSGNAWPIAHTVTVNVTPKLCTSNTLRPGLWMQSEKAWLVLQFDGNFVLYRKRDGAVLWNTRTAGRRDPMVWMQSDGNLVVMSQGITVASSRTWGNPGAHAELQDDGNFVIYRHDGNNPADAIWSTNTWKTANQ